MASIPGNMAAPGPTECLVEVSSAPLASGYKTQAAPQQHAASGIQQAPWQQEQLGSRRPGGQHRVAAWAPLRHWLRTLDPRQRLCLGAGLGVAVAAAIITIIVLAATGNLSGSSGGSWTPLPLSPRRRNSTAPPAFLSELHPWLLPREQMAMGLNLTADVIIVGAGMAGLRAAQVLSTNMSVLVLEARDRVGGRIHSVPLGDSSSGSGGGGSGAASGTGHAELGAQFIWGAASNSELGPQKGNPITLAANSLGLIRIMLSGKPSMQRHYGPDGRPLSPKQLTSLGRWERDFEAVTSAAGANQSLQDVIWQPELQARLGGSGSSRQGNQGLLEAAVQARYGVQYGGGLRQLSALYFDNHTSFGGADDIVLGGFGAITSSYAAPLGSRLRLNTPVVAIRHGDSNATVITAAGQELTAQFVICTVPLGVLQAGGVQFDPPLPQETQEAVGKLGVGHLEKLWMEFEQAFWDEQPCGSKEHRAPCEQIDYLAPPTNYSGPITLRSDGSSTANSSGSNIASASSNTSGNDTSGANGSGSSSMSKYSWRIFHSMAAYSRRPVLVAEAVAGEAAGLQGMADGDAVASAMAVLHSMFPAAAAAGAQPTRYWLSRWGQDPWARGSMSYYTVGSTPSDRATLAEPQSGSLVLAGEASSVQYPSTVHGAYLSGQEAAYRVMAAASELPFCSTGGGGGAAAGCVAAPAVAVAARAAAGADGTGCTCDQPGTLL